jgi:hypothetical protein
VSVHNNPDLRSRNDMDAVRDITRELADIAHHFSALKGEVNACLSDPNYATLPFRLENAHAPVEAAAVRRGGGYGCTRVKRGDQEGAERSWWKRNPALRPARSTARTLARQSVDVRWCCGLAALGPPVGPGN